MRFSLEWLRDHVEIDLDPKSLAARLTAVGLAVEGIEAAGDDTVLDVEVTTNRPDCMSHRGLAREIAAATGRTLRPLDSSFAEASRPAAKAARVEIEAPDLCARYTARVLVGLKTGPSPAWLERRLRAVGLTSGLNIVDAANYVLWDLGHPLHTFDLSRLEGGAIVVRKARAGERLVTVADGLDHPLEPSMLVIADAKRPVAVAGVMGGIESAISETTEDVLVESAWFDPLSVRRTARALGMHTDASHRFERGADPAIPPLAAARLCALLLRIAGGECLAGAIDVVAVPAPARSARLRRDRLAALLGLAVPDERVESVLRGLEIPIAPDGSGGGWSAALPSHRPDLQAEEDLIEEVARSVGYDAIPSTLPTATVLPPERLRREEADDAARRELARLGYCETIGYAMANATEDELFAPEGTAAPVIANPLSDRWEVMRRSLMPGLIQAAGHNVRHGRRNLALFEVGTIFRSAEPAPAGAAEPRLPVEQRAAGLIGAGRFGGDRWSLPRREFDLHDVTGALEALARALGGPEIRFVASPRPFLHPRQAFSARADGREIGFGGALHPELCERFDLPPGCCIGQIAVGEIVRMRVPPPRFRPLPRFPSVSRDISALVPAGVPYAEVERCVRGALEGAPARFVLTDRYEGPPLPEGRVSLTVGICVEPEERTWTLEEIDALTGRVIGALEAAIGAEIRR